MKSISMLAVGLALAASATVAVGQDRSREIDYGDGRTADSAAATTEDEKQPAYDRGDRGGAHNGSQQPPRHDGGQHHDGARRDSRPPGGFDGTHYNRDAARQEAERFSHDGGRRDGNRYDGRHDGNHYDGRRDGYRHDGRYDGDRYGRHDRRYDGHRYDGHHGDWRDREGDWRLSGHRYAYRHDGWAYRNNYRHYGRYRAPSRYAYPRGYYSYAWSIGHRLPRSYYGPSYYVDYRPYHLPPPPYGHRWVRVDDDVLLVAIATGLIVDVLSDMLYY